MQEEYEGLVWDLLKELRAEGLPEEEAQEKAEEYARVTMDERYYPEAAVRY
jgi:hypothetical protein